MLRTIALSALFTLVAVPSASAAVPSRVRAVESSEPAGTPQALTTVEVDTFTPYSWYASAGHCAAADTLSWSCGANCDANPQFKPVASGGDSAVVQYWYVGYDPLLKSVIVAHEGTVPRQILPLITDLDIALRSPNGTLFPGLDPDITVHEGFHDAFAKAIPDILLAVQHALALYSATHVTTVGHSLGAALALLDGVYLPLHLPPSTTFSTYAFGLPRVGNGAFASYVDSAASGVRLARVTNRRDPMPILPGRFLGFVHPAGEVHVQDPSGAWYACPGEDNASEMCAVGQVRNLLGADSADHDGPYGPVTMGC